jgi:hypothetical protein
MNAVRPYLLTGGRQHPQMPLNLIGDASLAGVPQE